MQYVWSVLCRQASVDNPTNTLSMFDCLEQINVTIDKSDKSDKKKIGEPINIPLEFEMVQFWRDENVNRDRTFEVKVELRDANNKILKELDSRLILKKGIKRMRNRMHIKGFLATVAGTYYFVVKLKERNRYKEVGRVPLDVAIQYKL